MTNRLCGLAQSPTAIVRAHLEAYRIQMGWTSQEKLAVAVVEIHQALNAEAVTGHGFQAGRDIFADAHANAVKLYRWLNGDVNLPADLMPTLLGVLPVEQRVACLNAMYGCLGVRVVPDFESGEAPEATIARLLPAVMREGGEAQLAIAGLLGDASHASVAIAVREIREAINALAGAEQVLAGRLTQPESVPS